MAEKELDEAETKSVRQLPDDAQTVWLCKEEVIFAVTLCPYAINCCCCHSVALRSNIRTCAQMYASDIDLQRDRASTLAACEEALETSTRTATGMQAGKQQQLQQRRRGGAFCATLIAKFM